MGGPAAFLSYALEDDADEGGKITWFRTELERRVRFQGLTSFEIFQDRASIEHSARWSQMVDGVLDLTSVLIPILTPRWFSSAECRRELEYFRERERALGRDNLVFGIYWFPTDRRDDPALRRTDKLAVDLIERVLFHWHELRYEPATSVIVQRRLDEIASRVTGVIGASSPSIASGSLSSHAPPSRVLEAPQSSQLW